MSLLDSIHLFNSHIGDSKKILITAHKNPDTDAIGSCLALAHYFSSELKKDIKIWIKESVKDFEFLPNKQFFENKFPKEYKFDTLIVCDCSTLDRINHVSFINDVQHEYTTINIDHHPDNTKFGDINVVTKISSVGELIFLDAYS